jgi:hypothetical protein
MIHPTLSFLFLRMVIYTVTLQLALEEDLIAARLGLVDYQ